MIANFSGSLISYTIITVFSTIMLFQFIAICQKKLNALWLQPMLFAIIGTMIILLVLNINFAQYYSYTAPLQLLLEAAVVALGFPLFQHLRTITKQWRSILLILILGAIIAITLSFVITLMIIGDYAIAVALSLKSVTTPIAIAVAAQLDGNIAITAFAIILAGFFGAIIGPRWLNFIQVKSAKSQGLAIGAASHAIGTATVSNISYEHAAYSSLALIVSAVITAVISPLFIELLSNLISS